MPEEDADKALKEHSGELMSIPGVVGTGRGMCGEGPCIKVFVIKKTPEIEKKVPKNIDGVPVELVETGGIMPLDRGK